MLPTLRRLYATIPDAAAVARTASAPRAVRLRRSKQGHDVENSQSDATLEGLTPTEFERYQRALAKGELYKDDGSVLTEAEWLEKLDSRRSRVRGFREVVKDGETETEITVHHRGRAEDQRSSSCGRRRRDGDEEANAKPKAKL